MKRRHLSLSRRFESELAFSGIVLVSLLLAILLAGCGAGETTLTETTAATPTTTGTGSTEAGTVQVDMRNILFVPQTITIKVNQTVTWTNSDNVPHDVTADDGSFGSGTINPDGTYSHTFTTAGTFPYKCVRHPPDMVGTVIVQ